MAKNPAPRPLRTQEIAKTLGVHANTIRNYEAWGYLPKIPRGENGYRQYAPIHLEQARLACLALQWPSLNDRSLLIDMVKCAADGDFGTAMELAYKYLAAVRVERTYAEAAIEFLEHWAAGRWIEAPQRRVHINEAATRLNVTVDMLRNWERSGLLNVPRDPANGYRLYGAAEFGRIRVIRTLVQAGYSLMAILRMLSRFDAGDTSNLRQALDLPLEESANEAIEIAADRWLSSLVAMEDRAQALIGQIGVLLHMSHP